MILTAMERNIMTQETITRDKLAYSVEQISAQTSLSKAFLRNEIRAGHLKAQRFGRRVLVLNDDLQAYLKREVETN